MDFLTYLFNVISTWVGGTFFGVVFYMLWQARKNDKVARIAIVILYLIVTAFLINAYFVAHSSTH